MRKSTPKIHVFGDNGFFASLRAVGAEIPKSFGIAIGG